MRTFNAHLNKNYIINNRAFNAHIQVENTIAQIL